MRIVERVVIQASAAAIWQVISDVEHWPEWTPTTLRVQPLTEGSLQVGARYRVSQPKLRPAVYEVTECTPEKVFTWVSRMPGATMTADHRIIPLNTGMEVELAFVTAGFLGNLVGKLYARLIADYVATEARSLKARCERLPVGRV